MSSNQMKLERVELLRLEMPLVSPFRTSFGVQTARDVLLVVAHTTDGAVGYGECVALAEPVYSEEYVDGAAHVLEHYLVPAVLACEDLTAARVAELTEGFVGHRMAKAALELAVLDAELRQAGMSLAAYLGGTRERVPVGVSVGITDTIGQLVETVQRYREQGYGRIKLKIEPGFDLEPVRAVREAVGPDVPLQVDGNTAYRAADLAHVAKLDDLGLLLIEQPFEHDAIALHAELARRCRTPICLDESITSAAATARAILAGACSIVNLKAARMGGYLEARRAHDVAQALDTPVWCGGMLETGLGRAANLALAALPGFALPGDISASARYYAEDLTEPFIMVDGQIEVPRGPGLGLTVREDVLGSVLTERREIRA
ncbi:o-succinylbenzoate synthase [uncultured Friedmanniella sp.]|uniref:o-succinylbenzoate synthase n=1 Tax=uncultured Friedmanniella sp. TaxID=335381 RepID=UPI0035CC8C26